MCYLALIAICKDVLGGLGEVHKFVRKCPTQNTGTYTLKGKQLFVVVVVINFFSVKLS